MLTSDLKVVNDIAEREVRLMEEFKDILTDDEEQRRMLLHCVEDTRKLHSDFRKSTSLRHTELIISNRDRSLYHCLGINNKGSLAYTLRDRKRRNLNFGQHLDVVFRI